VRKAALGTWRLTLRGKEVFNKPRVGVLRSIMLNHWYHHRGQLSVYLRLLEVPVPVIYGRSADENRLLEAGPIEMVNHAIHHERRVRQLLLGSHSLNEKRNVWRARVQEWHDSPSRLARFKQTGSHQRCDIDHRDRNLKQPKVRPTVGPDDGTSGSA